MKFGSFQISKRSLLMVLGLFVAAVLFIVGKDPHAAGGVMTANAAAVSLTAEEKAELNESEQKFMLSVKKMMEQTKADIKAGKISPEEAAQFKAGVIEALSNGELKALKDQLADLDRKAKEQGTSLSEISLKLDTHGSGGSFKSIAQVFKENEDAILKTYQNGSGNVSFLVTQKSNGEFVMRKFDPTRKADMTIATVGGVGGDGTAAVAQSISAQALLRLGGNAEIVSQYRNNAWLLDQVNVINAAPDSMLAMWYEEQDPEGASDTVVEGATKPKRKYSYELKSAQYKKEAMLLSFTDEFAMDFARLQSDIMGKGRIDLLNSVNSKIQTNLVAAATAYNTGALFNGGTPLTDAQYNDWVAIAAMAAQVDNATYGAMANTALMSTFKKYRMGTTTDLDGRWIDRPTILNPVSFIGNADMTADQIVVGDLKAYNVILRGGFIVKVGYNGTDFAENKFSVVMEQFYQEYIANIRKKAIVKGPNFADVKGALQS